MEAASVSVCSVVDVLFQRAIAEPARTAYSFVIDDFRQESVTFGDLADTVKAWAGWIAERTHEGDRVLIALSPGLDFVALFFACVFAGRIAVPAAPPRGSRARLMAAAIADNCTPALIVVDDELGGAVIAQLAEHAPVALCEEMSAGPTYDRPGPRPHDLALLQYTSGSTGQPKGVMISHANLLHNLELQRDLYGVGPGSRGVIWLPPNHDMGLSSGVLQPIYSGADITLMSPLYAMQRPARWLQLISETGATISGAPTSAYRACLQSVSPSELEGLDLSTWSCAFVGAEPVPHTVLAAFAERFGPCGFRADAFLPCYGLAEATVLVSGDKGRRGLAASPAVGCGWPADDVELLIIDPVAATPRADGEEGEIWLRGPSVAQGYWRAARATATTFGARLADGDGPYLRTGDLGRRVADQLVITGRIKDLVIFAGRKIHAEDIEASVRRAGHAKITEATAVAAYAYEEGGAEKLGLALELRRTASSEETEDLRSMITGVIAREHEVSVGKLSLVRPGDLPRTSSGKIKRYACAGHLATRTMARA